MLLEYKLNTTEANNFLVYGIFAHHIIQVYIPPLLLAIGTIGNTLNILVLTRSDLRHQSLQTRIPYPVKQVATQYVIALAVVDLVVLYGGMLPEWLGKMGHDLLRKHHQGLCKLFIFLRYSSLTVSAWIVTIITIERFVYVWYPLRRAHIFSMKQAKYVVTVVVTAVSLIYSAWFWSIGRQVQHLELVSGNVTLNSTRVHNCRFKEKFWEFNIVFMAWLDMCALCVFPSLVILPLNLLIIARMVRTRCSALYKRSLASGSVPIGGMTAMLLVSSITFVVATAPVSVFMILQQYLVSRAESQMDNLFLMLLRDGSIKLQYANNAINFLLYCAVGSNFRREFRRIVLECQLLGKRHSRTLSRGAVGCRTTGPGASLMVALRGMSGSSPRTLPAHTCRHFHAKKTRYTERRHAVIPRIRSGTECSVEQDPAEEFEMENKHIGFTRIQHVTESTFATASSPMLPQEGIHDSYGEAIDGTLNKIDNAIDEQETPENAQIHYDTTLCDAGPLARPRILFVVAQVTRDADEEPRENGLLRESAV